MRFVGQRQNMEFAVECKWRQRSINYGIAFSSQNQLDRYRDFAREKDVSVFMVIGLGGKGASPKRLFIVPLIDISEPFMLLDQLNKYEKNVVANFYFNHEKGELK